MKAHLFAALGILVTFTGLGADGPADNQVEKVRSVPPPGIVVPDQDSKELAQGVEELGKAIAELRSSLKAKPALMELVPDVQIYHNAVRYALSHQEFFKPGELVVARKLLKQGMERAGQLRKG